MADVGKNIKLIRSNLHLSQEQLAEKLFVTRQAVSNWENGKTQPDLCMLEKIAEALTVESTDLIYGPQYGLRRYSEKWLAFFSGVLIVIAIWRLTNTGLFSTICEGLSYQLTSRDYSVTVTALEDPITVEIPLRDRDALENYPVYEDGNHRITLSSLIWNNNDDGCWELWFRSEADVHTSGSSVLSSGMASSYHHQYDDLETAEMTMTVDGHTYCCTPAGSVHPNHKKDVYFSYTLFPGDGNPEHLPETASMTLEGLLYFETRHLPGDIP